MLYVLRTYSIDSIMKLLKAMALSIGEIEYPVITSYLLGVIVFNLYKKSAFKGEEISSLQKSYADSGAYNHILRDLLAEGILNKYKGFPDKAVFSLLGRKSDSLEDVVCTVDPFAYVSHLSSMAFHGLTNRTPIKLFISSPPPREWKAFALERMEKGLRSDLSMYKSNGLPTLKKVAIKKIGKKEVHRFGSVHLGMFRSVRGRAMRVSTIGRTFLDMLRNPELCGGINHVLEVYGEHSKTYLKTIIDEIDQHGGPIDKVRAGYILDERLGHQNDRIDRWLKYVQRGGSRKLDSSNEYEPVWSERWCLSLNTIESANSRL